MFRRALIPTKNTSTTRRLYSCFPPSNKTHLDLSKPLSDTKISLGNLLETKIEQFNLITDLRNDCSKQKINSGSDISAYVNYVHAYMNLLKLQNSARELFADMQNKNLTDKQTFFVYTLLENFLSDKPDVGISFLLNEQLEKIKKLQPFYHTKLVDQYLSDKDSMATIYFMGLDRAILLRKETPELQGVFLPSPLKEIHKNTQKNALEEAKNVYTFHKKIADEEWERKYDEASNQCSGNRSFGKR